MYVEEYNVQNFRKQIFLTWRNRLMDSSQEWNVYVIEGQADM